MSVFGHGVEICTSVTRPSPQDGSIIYETDTNNLLVYSNTVWTPIVLGFINTSVKTSGYTLAAIDVNTFIELNSTSSLTLTVPNDSSVNFNVGTQINILQTNTGQVTVAGAGGVTVNATPGLKLRTQWSSATLIKRASNVWVAIGDLVA